MLFGLSLRNIFILVIVVLIYFIFWFILLKVKNKKTKLILGGFIFSSLFTINYYLHNWVFSFLILPIISFGVAGLLYLFSLPAKKNEVWDVVFKTNKGDKILKGLQRGVAIFGAAGSGKTASVIYTILKHLGVQNFSGIIYDFKDGELTELAVPIFGERLKVVAIHQPHIGYRVNPISPKYISGEKDVNEIVSVIMDNLTSSGVGSGDSFFKDSASSLLAGVILKFYNDHKSYCTLPHIISFILGLDFSVSEPPKKNQSLGEQAENKFAKLKDFLTKDDRVAIQSSTFILGLASEKQTAAVLSTLANALRKISFPEAYWVLSGDDLDLDINSEKTDLVLSIINEPKSSRFLSPINATIIHTITKQMMVRNRKQSFILLDEAPTIKLLNMAQIPATMRSFNVATIYCAQDIVQGTVQYGRDGFKEIITNLSTQFFGKANDPDTAKYYEGYFELVKEEMKSVSRKGGSGDLFSTGTTNTTTSYREVSKVRANVFTKLGIGQFAMLSDGKSDIVQFPKPDLIAEPVKGKKKIEQSVLNDNFSKIVNEVKFIINKNIVNQDDI